MGAFFICAVDFGFTEENSEYVSFLGDHPIWNLFATGTMLSLLLLTIRRDVSRRTVGICYGIMLLFVTGLGTRWVLAARTLPYAAYSVNALRRRIVAGKDGKFR